MPNRLILRLPVPNYDLAQTAYVKTPALMGSFLHNMVRLTLQFYFGNHYTSNRAFSGSNLSILNGLIARSARVNCARRSVLSELNALVPVH